jgi:hypothetical protein
MPGPADEVRQVDESGPGLQTPAASSQVAVQPAAALTRAGAEGRGG